MKDVAVITVAYNKPRSLDACLRSIRRNTNCTFDIFVIDNASTTPILPIAKRYRAKYYRMKKNYYASRAINTGVTHFHITKNYRHILILGSDVLLEKSLISKLMKTLDANPHIAITGPGHYDIRTKKLLSFGIHIDPNTSLLRNFNEPRLKTGMNHFHSLYMVRGEAFTRAKGFNSILFPMIYEEPDLGERVQLLGYTIQSTPSAKIWHSLDEIFEVQIDPLARTKRLINSRAKAYLFFRNRIIYMRRYTSWYQFLFFLLVPLPLITLFYLPKVSIRYLPILGVGIIHGLVFSFTQNQRLVKKFNSQILHI